MKTTKFLFLFCLCLFGQTKVFLTRPITDEEQVTAEMVTKRN